ncbi:MAG: hypothetical protein JWN86_2361 [Planctomycetota bacterium]|nr:hypothetical protein [Planctomycetota bacterium]
MLATLLVLSAIAENPAERIGRMDHPAIAEASGIVASRRHPGIFWVHNDSGNPPALFAIRKDGTLVREYRVAAPNVDWEDIATDDSGHLYIGDIGDNLGTLPVRAIYQIDEPDPAIPPLSKATLPVTRVTYFRYPGSAKLNAESLFIDDNRAFVVAKSSDNREAAMFALSLQEPAPLLRPLMAENAGSLPGFTRPATGADLSADGKWLAVCALDEVRIYRRDADGRWLPEAHLKGPKGQVEAICWDGRDLILASEQRDLFRIAERSWRSVKRPKVRTP